MQDGWIPKDIMYGELATGTRPTGRLVLWYKDVCKRDLIAGSLNPADLETASADRARWRLASRTCTKLCEGKRQDQLEEKRRRSQCPQNQSPASPVVTPTDSAALVLYCLATADTAIPQQTDPGADTPKDPDD